MERWTKVYNVKYMPYFSQSTAILSTRALLFI